MLGELSFDEGEDPRDVLQNFVADLVAFLVAVTGNRERTWKPKFRETLIGPMRAAVTTLPGHAGSVNERIAQLTDAEIRDHGLSGRELAFKFAVINDAYRAGQNGWSFLRWRRLIDALDVLLASILSAAAAGTAIAEVKDYLGLSVEYE